MRLLLVLNFESYFNSYAATFYFSHGLAYTATFDFASHERISSFTVTFKLRNWVFVGLHSAVILYEQFEVVSNVVTGLPCCYKFHVLNVIFILVAMFLNFKRLTRL
jgi:hypothetical protein